MELLSGFMNGSDKNSNNLVFLVFAFLIIFGFGNDRHKKHHHRHGGSFLNLLG